MLYVCVFVCVIHKLNICGPQNENAGRILVHPCRRCLHTAAALTRSLGIGEKREKVRVRADFISSSDLIPSGWWWLWCSWYLTVAASRHTRAFWRAHASWGGACTGVQASASALCLHSEGRTGSHVTGRVKGQSAHWGWRATSEWQFSVLWGS